MKVLCPGCKKFVEFENNPYRPFCSERCKLLDLGAWAMEKHAIPAVEEDDDGEKATTAPEKDDES
jgi:endogenous inhibitor of DNA gyrase (YacG/DUF329 family)